MTARLDNRFEGGTDGVSVSTGNSSGSSGDAWDGITGAGSFVYDDDAPAPLIGAMSALISAGAAQTLTATWDSTSWQSETEVWVRAYIYKTSDPSSNTTIFRLVNSGTGGADVRITSGGQLQLRDANLVTRATSTALANDTLHRIEWRVLHSDTVGRLEARIFSGANAHGTTPDQTIGSSSTDRDTDAASDQIRVGILSAPGGSGWSFYLDSFAISNVDWIGPDVDTVSFTGSGAWGGLTGALSATVGHSATFAGSWSGLTASMAATVAHPVTATGSWGGLTGSMQAAPVRAFTAEGSWGGLSAAMAADVKKPFTAEGSWGGLAGAMTATVSHGATMTGSWGALVASMAATVSQLSVTMTANWGGLTGSMSPTVALPFTATGVWGGLTAAASPTVIHPVTAVGTWGALTGAMSADVTTPGSGAWGGLTGALSATVGHSATFSGSWGALAASMAATVAHPVTATGSWGGLTGSCTFTVTTPPSGPVTSFEAVGFWGGLTGHMQGPGPRRRNYTHLGVISDNRTTTRPAEIFDRDSGVPPGRPAPGSYLERVTR